MRIIDWSSDVCSSDLDQLCCRAGAAQPDRDELAPLRFVVESEEPLDLIERPLRQVVDRAHRRMDLLGTWRNDQAIVADRLALFGLIRLDRAEERRVGEECVSTCRSRWAANH